jgi:predicted O-methyltransferase YrrM
MLEELIEKYGQEYVDYVLPDLPMSAYGNLESMFLYAFIRDIKPETVAEIGTEHRSRSSYLIESALKRNALPTLHIMADLSGVVETARQNLSLKFDTNIKILSGDIRETFTQQNWKDVDFLFIDADHGQAFAEWYFEELFPLLCEGVPIHVHDIDLWGNWQWYKSPYPSEAMEFLRKHKDGSLSLERLLWLFNYTYNPEYKPLLAKLKEKYPFVGDQTFEEPFKNGASYWRKDAS